MKLLITRRRDTNSSPPHRDPVGDDIFQLIAEQSRPELYWAIFEELGAELG